LYLQDSTTACGDILELGQQGLFKVKRVIFLYKYNGHKYRVVRKKLEVLKSSREMSKSTTSFSNRKPALLSSENEVDNSIEAALLNADTEGHGYLQ